MTSVPSRREFDIDFFRGFVCLCLATLHFYNSALYDSFMNLFGETGKWIVWNLRLGVESFFILAGFMMAHMMRPVPGEEVSILGYLKRRFWRLIVPYWIAVLLFTAYRWGIFTIFKRGDGPLSAIDVISQMFLVQEFLYDSSEAIERVSPVGYWSMVTLEQFYLVWLALYAITLALVGRGDGRGYARAEKVMAFITFAACVGSLSLWILPFHTHYHLPAYTVFLTMGMLLYWAQRHGFSRHYFWIMVPLLLAAAIYSKQGTLIKALITTAIFLPLSRGVELPRNAIVRFLNYCGRRSYSIYLIHPIVGIAFIALTWKLTAKSDWLAIPLLIGAIIVSVLAAIVFYKYVELPSQARSRSVQYRRQSGSLSQTAIKAGEPVKV
jgi:peptidoglycan/LPS O-acetylase OafA/YrhL